MVAPGARDGWIDSEGVRLHYTEWPSEGPPMLCIHGLTGNSRWWDGLAERLSPRYRLIAPDLRGRGLTDTPPAGGFGMLAHMRDMAALLRHLGTGPAAVVGHSMGAAVAALLAAHYPELVSQVVLADGGAFGEGMTLANTRPQIQAALARLSVVYPSLEAYLDYWGKFPFIDVNNEHFRRYLMADVKQRPDGSVASRVSAMGVEEDLTGSEYDEEQVLSRVQAPTLVLSAPVGLQDPAKPLFPPAALRRAAEILPRGRFVSLDGANHYNLFHAPAALDQVEAALAQLLQ